MIHAADATHVEISTTIYKFPVIPIYGCCIILHTRQDGPFHKELALSSTM